MSEAIPADVADRIRELAEQIDDPDKWMVTVPERYYDDVKSELDTDYDTGTYFQGIALCYTTNHDSAHVEYKSSLKDHVSQ